MQHIMSYMLCSNVWENEYTFILIELFKFYKILYSNAILYEKSRCQNYLKCNQTMLNQL